MLCSTSRFFPAVFLFCISLGVVGLAGTAMGQHELTLIVEVWDLPVGAEFIDSGNGMGLFNWPDATPGGEYYVNFRAFDGLDADTGTVRITVAADTLDLGFLTCGSGHQGETQTLMTEVELLHPVHEISAFEVRARLQPPDIGEFTEVIFNADLLPEADWNLSVHVSPDTSWVVEILALDTSGAHPLAPDSAPQHLFDIYGDIADSIADPQSGYPIPLPDTVIDIFVPEGNFRLTGPQGSDEWYLPPVRCFFEVSSEGLEQFVRGDATADGSIDIFDGLRIIYWLGGEADAPPCENAADVTDDEAVNIFDGLRVVYYLGGEADPPPEPCCVPPEDCGADPTPGGLTCLSFPPCGWNPKSVATTAHVGRAEESRLVVQEAVARNRAVVVPVILTNAEPVVGFSFVIEYDWGLVTATAVDNAGLITEEFDVFAGGVSEPGLIKVAAVSDMTVGDGVEKMPAGEHHVATIVFETKETLDRDVVLDLTEGIVAIDHDRSLSHRLVDGSIKATLELPEVFSLSQNYPNPFNPITEISYALPFGCQVKLEIHNILGRRVITLVDEHQKAGYKTVRWDGSDEQGNAVASGVYMYRLKVGEFMATGKAVLLR